MGPIDKSQAYRIPETERRVGFEVSKMTVKQRKQYIKSDDAMLVTDAKKAREVMRGHVEEFKMLGNLQKKGMHGLSDRVFVYTEYAVGMIKAKGRLWASSNRKHVDDFGKNLRKLSSQFDPDNAQGKNLASSSARLEEVLNKQAEALSTIEQIPKRIFERKTDSLNGMIEVMRASTAEKLEIDNMKYVFRKNCETIKHIAERGFKTGHIVSATKQINSLVERNERVIDKDDPYSVIVQQQKVIHDIEFINKSLTGVKSKKDVLVQLKLLKSRINLVQEYTKQFAEREGYLYPSASFTDIKQSSNYKNLEQIIENLEREITNPTETEQNKAEIATLKEYQNHIQINDRQRTQKYQEINDLKEEIKNFKGEKTIEGSAELVELEEKLKKVGVEVRDLENRHGVLSARKTQIEDKLFTPNKDDLKKAAQAVTDCNTMLIQNSFIDRNTLLYMNALKAKREYYKQNPDEMIRVAEKCFNPDDLKMKSFALASNEFYEETGWLPNEFFNHEVKEGETLWEIRKDHEYDFNTIENANTKIKKLAAELIELQKAHPKLVSKAEKKNAKLQKKTDDLIFQVEKNPFPDVSSVYAVRARAKELNRQFSEIMKERNEPVNPKITRNEEKINGIIRQLNETQDAGRHAELTKELREAQRDHNRIIAEDNARTAKLKDTKAINPEVQKIEEKMNEIIKEISQLVAEKELFEVQEELHKTPAGMKKDQARAISDRIVTMADAYGHEYAKRIMKTGSSEESIFHLRKFTKKEKDAESKRAYYAGFNHILHSLTGVRVKEEEGVKAKGGVGVIWHTAHIPESEISADVDKLQQNFLLEVHQYNHNFHAEYKKVGEVITDRFNPAWNDPDQKLKRDRLFLKYAEGRLASINREISGEQSKIRNNSGGSIVPRFLSSALMMQDNEVREGKNRLRALEKEKEKLTTAVKFVGHRTKIE